MKKFVNAFFAFCLALVMCTLVLSSCKNKNQAPENVETKELRCETSYCNLDIDSIYQNALYATPFNNISLRELPKVKFQSCFPEGILIIMGNSKPFNDSTQISLNTVRTQK